MPPKEEDAKVLKPASSADGAVRRLPELSDLQYV